MIKEYERVVLTEDLPNTDLRKDDVGVVVMIYNEGKAYEVEFFSLDGETIAVETLYASQLREVKKSEILHVRDMEAA